MNVKSSTVSSVDYDVKTKILTVTFKTGSVYHYADVPPATFDELSKAASVGKFLHTHVYPKHKSYKQD